MKNRFLFFAILAVLVFSSCKNDEEGVVVVRLDVTSAEIVKGETLQLKAVTVPADDDAVIEWFSEDESYVQVDQNGLVTAVAVNKDEVISDDEENTQAISVYARCGNGAAECEITVLPLEADAIRIVPEQKRMNVGEQYLFTVEFEPQDADVRDVEWSTTVASVATVKDGVVTVHGYGTCEIIAKCGKAESRAYILVL